jgi:stage V sporulation protein B
MKPTATSQVIEQGVKLVFGLIFAYLFRANVAFAVAGATGAITLSELVALFYLYLLYRRDRLGVEVDKNRVKENFSIYAKEILRVTFPITIVGIMLPISHVIDSFVIVNVLSTHTSSATSLYGILGGVVCTVISLPVSVCYGISTSSIPSVSSAKSLQEKRDRANSGILLTTAVSFPFYLAVLIFAPLIVNVLFPSLGVGEKFIAINLLRITAPSVMLLSLVQTTNAVLIGKGKLYFPVLSMAIGVIIKTMLNVFLMADPKISVRGGGIALIACYFVAVMINFIILTLKGTENASKTTYRRQGQTE